jgi:hypothetical protein
MDGLNRERAERKTPVMNAIVVGVNGVLLTSERAREVFRKRSVDFIAAKTGESERTSRLIDFHGRNSHGNAALGLRAFRPDLSVSVDEYSRFVYDPRAVDEALAAAEGDCAFEKDKYKARVFFEEANATGSKVFLFTGGTTGYVDALVDRLDVSHLVDPTSVFACDTVGGNNDMVKGSHQMFAATNFAIRSRCRGRSRVLFLDSNLWTVMAARGSGVGWFTSEFDHEKNGLIESSMFFMRG